MITAALLATTVSKPRLRLLANRTPVLCRSVKDLGQWRIDGRPGWAGSC